MSERSGRARVVVPSQFPLPAAFVDTRLMTHVLVAWLLGFGMASGGPKRQPLRSQSLLTEQTAFLAPAVHFPLVQTPAGYSGFATPAELQWRFGWTLPETSVA